jgi:Transglycosylase SLT domain
VKIWQLAGIVIAVAMTAISLALLGTAPGSAPSNAAAEPEVVAASPASTSEVTATPGGASVHVASLPPEETVAGDNKAASDMKAASDIPVTKSAKLEQEQVSVRDLAPEQAPRKPDSYVTYYVYSELPPEKKPAVIVLDSLKDVPIGTPIEEIKRAADAFGLDFSFMRAVAKIESDFDPKQRTGQYIGLFQLNKYEFEKYGSGEITSPRDNAIAAAYKFVNEATLFEWDTHKRPTFSDLYLIHQQGWQGAAEHVAHPERIAWQSMCATDEGREKGERWCKRAIWGNTLPDIKRAWKSVDKLTSAAFVTMWRERVDHLYARYSDATASQPKH